MNENDLKSLPFDQYSRQRIVQNIIDDCIRRTEEQKFEIIDIGGHKGKTTEFQEKDKVTVLDVYDESYDNYLKGDARQLDFKDDNFDISVCFDVLEHIEKKDRTKVIKEALRVSRLGVFLALPVNAEDDDVKHTEILANRFYKGLFGEDHKWLKEHIEYGVPNTNEMKEILSSLRVGNTSFNSNRLDDWILMQSIIFLATKEQGLADLSRHINEEYNKQTVYVPDLQKSYRKIYFLTKDKKLLRKVRKFKNDLFKNYDETMSADHINVINGLLSILLKKDQIEKSGDTEPISGKSVANTVAQSKHIKGVVSGENKRRLTGEE